VQKGKTELFTGQFSLPGRRRGAAFRGLLALSGEKGKKKKRKGDKNLKLKKWGKGDLAVGTGEACMIIRERRKKRVSRFSERERVPCRST